MDTNIFASLGLAEKAGKVYLATLEEGPAPVQQIAQKADFPRATVYLLLEELKSRGLVSQTKFAKKTVFTASPPSHLLELAEENSRNSLKTMASLKTLLPRLQAIYNQKPDKPEVRFYEGFEGIKTILEETLEAREVLVLCSGYDLPVEKRLNRYLEGYFKEVVRRGIKTFEILGGGLDSEEYRKKYGGSLNKIKIVPRNESLDHIDKLIFADKLAIISYVFLNGVVIRNQPIADYEKSLFRQLWAKI
ncbi:MAG: helix-turn-helix domain-containing protein [bacterium]|nr:helix-turn-helix domain-containing protein [bacterium]